MEDNDLMATIILVFAIMVTSFAFGLFLVHVLPVQPEQSCQWISDKGVLFENEERIIEAISNISKDSEVSNFSSYKQGLDKQLHYGIKFVYNNITYLDVIRQVCR